MKKFQAAMVCGGMLAIATPAFAQSGYYFEDDEEQIDEKTWPALGFGGGHIEAIVGFDHMTGHSLKDIDSTANFFNSANGVAYGGGIGYDYTLNPTMVLGAEFDVTGSTADWKNPNVSSTFNMTRMRVGRDIFLGGRFGFLLNPKNLFYVKAGFANTQFSITGENTGETLHYDSNSSGLRFGFGVQHRLTKKTYAKIEYDYSHYGSGQFNYKGTTPDASYFALKNDRHQLMASIGFKF
ncbi:outer membrane protein [Novosphingobium nitrogenifigens]|nr:porin family protein [Novosphingobium nitrogenifigens]